MEAISALRHVLGLLDSLDLAEEAALVSQALEMLEAAAAPVSRVEAE